MSLKVEEMKTRTVFQEALIVDFGVESADHYRALKAAIFDDETDGMDEGNEEGVALEQRQRALVQERIVELDAAYGNAAKLNALIQRYAPAYTACVHFNPTDWDYLEGRALPDVAEESLSASDAPRKHP